jgi:hypothetical protein
VVISKPQARTFPRAKVSRGGEAIELAASAGLNLDPWQQDILTDALGVAKDGRWAAFEVGLVIPRQNGKTAVLEARELAGLFVFGEKLIIHSAHLADTSREAFNRVCDLLEEADLSSAVKHVWRTNGHEAIELHTGQRLKFRTRTKGGGRGFSADCVIFDEAMILMEASLAAIMPTVSARDNPQVWYAGSAVDQLVHEHGVVLTRLRERGRRGDSEALAYTEFAAAYDGPLDLVETSLLESETAWADANPGLNVRIKPELVRNELESMAYRTFAVERLGIGDWPPTDGTAGAVIDPRLWDRLIDPASKITDQLCLAFDVSPDRAHAAISAAGMRDDELAHLETIDHREGTGWVVARLVDLARRHKPAAIVCDGASPAASLIPEIEQLGIQVETVTAGQNAQACGFLFDAVDQETIRHLGQPELRSAIRGAARRPLGDAWAWSRKSSAVDISPLVAGTLAFWGWSTMRASRPFAVTW